MKSNAKLQVRVIAPWFGELETEEAFFSVHLPPEKADALLCHWAPAEELFAFPRRKAWCCCEPRVIFRGLEGGSWPAIRARLAPHEFLCHNHPDPRWRVPHMTHFAPLAVNHRTERKDRAVAVVSNHGGPPWRRHRDQGYRNGFVTHPLVDLYGRAGWQRYRAGWLSRPAAPANYRGEIPGDWEVAEKRELLAGYKVAVCLENSYEPYYFTEKFVEAVCAGCVPVYRAHPTVAEGVLRGAAWVDPAGFGHDRTATLEAALSRDARAMREQNEQWLRGPAVAETHKAAIFARIGRLLAQG